MKLFFLFFTLTNANFLDREESSQFLTQRSKCGDDCTKAKTKVKKILLWENLTIFFVTDKSKIIFSSDFFPKRRFEYESFFLFLLKI